jgi:uncharacterized RDD family membrane protein YckC
METDLNHPKIDETVDAADVGDPSWTKNSVDRSKSHAASSFPRPWLRYWAKIVDVWLCCFLLALLLGGVFPQWINETNDTLLGLILLALAVPVQALLLSAWGTTPGKVLLGIRVSKNERNLDFGQAFKREMSVYFVGLGLGIPIIALFTQISAYNYLKKHGASSWDDGPGNVVTQKDPSVAGIVCVFVILFLALTIIVYGNGVGGGY